MHKPESALENETHKILWYFEIQIEHLFSARRPDLQLEKKKIVHFGVPANHRVKLKENS